MRLAFGNLSREYSGLSRASAGSFALPPRRSERHPNQDEPSPGRQYGRASDEFDDEGDGNCESEETDGRSHASDQSFSPPRYFASGNASRNRPEYSPREDFLVHAFDSNAMKLESHESLGDDNQQEDASAAVTAESEDPPYALHNAMDIRVAQTFSGPHRARPSAEETSREQSDSALYRSGARSEVLPTDSFAFADSGDYEGVGSRAGATSDRVFLGKRVGRFSHSTSSEPPTSLTNQFDVLAARPLSFPPPQSSTAYPPVFPLYQHHDYMPMDTSMAQPRKKSIKKSDNRSASTTPSGEAPTLNLASPPPSRSPMSGPPSRWLREEDEQLREAVARFGGKNWKMIAEALGNSRTDVQCLHRWNKVLKPGLVKGPWTPEEDGVLSQLIARYGVGKIRWCDVAQHLPGRIGKQCRERWCNHLDSRIRKGQWTPEEDDVVFRWQQKLGNKWSEIAKLLPGRTENAVKNRFNSAARRKWMMRVASSSGPTALASDEAVSGDFAGARSPDDHDHELMRRPPPPAMMPLIPGSAHHHPSPPGLLSPSSAFLFTRREPMTASGAGSLSTPDGMSRFEVEIKRPGGLSNAPRSAPAAQHLHFFQPSMLPPPPPPLLVPPSSMHRVDRGPHEPPSALLRPPPPLSMGQSAAELPIGLSLPAATFAPPPPPLLPPPPAGFSLSSAFAMVSDISTDSMGGTGRSGDDSGADHESTTSAEQMADDQPVKEKQEREQRPATAAGHEGMLMPAMDDENMSRFLDSVALELEDMME